MKDFNFKDVLIRMVKTFVQGFLGALAVTLPSSDLTSQDVIKSVLIGAIAAGVSAVMNLAVQYMQHKENEEIKKEQKAVEDLEEAIDKVKKTTKKTSK